MILTIKSKSLNVENLKEPWIKRFKQDDEIKGVGIIQTLQKKSTTQQINTICKIIELEMKWFSFNFNHDFDFDFGKGEDCIVFIVGVAVAGVSDTAKMLMDHFKNNTLIVEQYVAHIKANEFKEAYELDKKHLGKVSKLQRLHSSLINSVTLEINQYSHKISISSRFKKDMGKPKTMTLRNCSINKPELVNKPSAIFKGTHRKKQVNANLCFDEEMKDVVIQYGKDRVAVDITFKYYENDSRVKQGNLLSIKKSVKEKKDLFE